MFVFSSLICPYEYFKSEPYISAPLLSALNSARDKTNVISNTISHGSNNEIESRSFYSNSDQFDHSLRFASLGLAAKNIFQDMIVRRITGFARLVRLASNIWDSWKQFIIYVQLLHMWLISSHFKKIHFDIVLNIE